MDASFAHAKCKIESSAGCGEFATYVVPWRYKLYVNKCCMNAWKL